MCLNYACLSGGLESDLNFSFKDRAYGFTDGLKDLNGKNDLIQFITVLLDAVSILPTHLSRMEFPTVINWTSPFRFQCCRVVFNIFIQLSIDDPVSK